MSDVALIFVYNHRYDHNIAVLESIYGNRFSNIFHLVPFYDGDKENVIPVYENSFYFQGYISQGLRHYFSERFEHYLFVADDLMLNPAINEYNYAAHFRLTADASYIPEVFQLHHLTGNDTLRFVSFSSLPGKAGKLFWWRNKMAVRYQHEKAGLEIKSQMPSYAVAEKKLDDHGYPIQPLSYQDVHGGLFPFSVDTHEERLHVAKYLYNLPAVKKQYHLSYPMVGSYSDIVIVSKYHIRKFCHYSGIFAAGELFVELAIPTALLLAAEKVITEKQIGRRGEIYWSYTRAEAEAYEQQMQLYHYDLQELLAGFPEDKLYIHPIKLSKWKTGIAQPTSL